MIHPPAEPPTEPGRRHGAGGCLPERDDPQTTPGHRPGAEADDWMPPRGEPPTDEELAGLCPDPFAGPPDGPDAWLADLSAPEVDAFLEAAAMAGTAARPASREAMAAGFTHRDPDPCAAGFAAGGPLDLLAPDPVLAGYAQDAFEAGLGTLGDDELIGLLCATRRLSSWQAAMELAAVTELDARRMAQAERPGSSRISEHISDEIAAAMTMTGRSAEALLGLARQLTRIPSVLAALFAGVIDRSRAAVFATELSVLSSIAAAAVAAAFCQDARLMTTGQLRAALRQMVLAIDPGAGRRRAEDGRADARVESWQENSGNGAIAGRELPAAEMIAADRRIGALARTLKAAGAPGTMDQLRTAVFSALLIGRDPGTLLPGSSTEPEGEPSNQAEGESSNQAEGEPSNQAAGAADGNSAAEPTGHRSGLDDHGGGGGPGPAGPTSGWTAGLVGSINLTMPLSSWLGLTDTPGEAAGLGPLDADTCRDLAGCLAVGQARWCVTMTDPSGRAAAHACARIGPGQARLRSPGPPRSPCSPSPPAAPSLRTPGTGPPLSSGAASPHLAVWLASLRFTSLEQGECSHQRQTPAYRPGPKLRHLIEIRQRTCAFPGCRRPARRCDIDHTQPWDEGGLTCECNCAPLCRQHHQAKQTSGWRLHQPEPGTLVWTLPHGRSYTVHPDSYPV